MKLIQQILQARKSLPKDGFIKKDASVQGYKAVTHDNVTAHVRQAFVDAGVLVYPQLKGSKTTLERVESNGKEKRVVFYESVYEFVLINEEGETLTVTVEAHAEDYGDKAAGKALSYAYKSFMLKIMMIETGENDESRLADTSTVSDSQVKILERYLSAIEDAEVRTRILNKYNIDSLHSLPRDKFNEVQSGLARIKGQEQGAKEAAK